MLYLGLGIEYYLFAVTPIAIRVINSATGIAIHMPIEPKNIGRRIKQGIRIIKPLKRTNHVALFISSIL